MPWPGPHNRSCWSGLSRPLGRKEAVVRGAAGGTGKFDLNGRSLEDYFPNKVHQQLIKAPLVTVDRGGKFRHLCPLRAAAARGSGAGALRLGIAPGIDSARWRTGLR